MLASLGSIPKPNLSRSRSLGASFLVPVFLLTSACGNRDTLAEKTANSQKAPRLHLSLTPAQIEIQRKVSRAHADDFALKSANDLMKRAMARVLFDPGSATYLDVRLGRNGAACGKLNAKNRYGAYVGFKDFVVEKSGNVLVSSYNDGIESETYSSFATAYRALCATKEEEARYAARTAPSSSTFEDLVPDPEPEPDRILDAPVTNERVDGTTT